MITIRTTEEISVVNGTGNDIKLTTLPPGKHNVEVIKSPIDGACEWFVIVGTKIGGPKSLWERLHSNGWMEFVYQD